MRLFVGVEVDDAVRHEAGRVASALRERLRGLDVRWVPPENVHLTVRFIGHVPNDREAPVLAALEQPPDDPGFDIEFGACGRFPPRGAPRVIWIGLRRGLASLSALHDEFGRRVAAFGYPPETRPFTTHLTLARIKDARHSFDRIVDSALAAIVVTPLVQRVGHVTIFESRLSPAGSQYDVLRRIALAG